VPPRWLRLGAFSDLLRAAITWDGPTVQTIRTRRVMHHPAPHGDRCSSVTGRAWPRPRKWPRVVAGSCKRAWPVQTIFQTDVHAIGSLPSSKESFCRRAVGIAAHLKQPSTRSVAAWAQWVLRNGHGARSEPVWQYTRGLCPNGQRAIRASVGPWHEMNPHDTLEAAARSDDRLSRCA
jgi:hypothetical protein